MSHKIIEREISWDDFLTLLLETTVLENNRYCFPISKIHLKHDKLEIINGPYVWNFFHKEDNELIKYGLGSFYFNKREYDEEEVGQDVDGYPIYDVLETYKIMETEIRLHQLKLL
jgi:hypothetical protein